LNSEVLSELAAALAFAIDTAKIAFAPNLFLLSVPSSLINKLSIFFCSKVDKPFTVLFISEFIFSTALKTPLLRYSLLLSLSS